MANRATRRRSARVVAAAGLTLATMLTATRPSIINKVSADAPENLYDWTKIEDLDLMGGIFTSVASSATGQHLVIGTEDGGEGYTAESPLFISDDYGATWTDVAEDVDSDIRHFWQAVDISNDGQTIVAVSDEAWDLDTFMGADSGVFISEDGGDTWDSITPPGDAVEWIDVAISGNGNTIAVLSDDYEDEINISTNGGTSWTTRTPDNVNLLESVSITDNGSKILVGGEDDDNLDPLVYLSDDNGVSWDDLSPSRDGDSFDVKTDISSDGNDIAAGILGYDDGYYSSVYVSENGTAPLAETTPGESGDRMWAGVAISGDGNIMSSLARDDEMYISKNNGDTWAEEDPGYADGDENTWRSIDINDSGSRAIVASEEFAYISETDNLGEEEDATPVVDFGNAEDGKTVVLTLPSGTTVTCQSAVKESALAVKDAGFQYPVGLVDFCFSTENEDNDISLLFVTELKPDQVVARKYNPTTQTYGAVEGVSITETTHNGQHALLVNYTIVDNGPLDTDPDVGEIADPVGIASTLGAPNTGTQGVRDLLFVRKDQ